MIAKQEALVVGYANDRTCSLHVKMLDVKNQHQSLKNAVSLSIKRLESELGSCHLRRDDIMREFRSNLRSRNNRYVECEHHLVLEEFQLRLQKVRNEGLQSQLALSKTDYQKTPPGLIRVGCVTWESWGYDQNST